MPLEGDIPGLGHLLRLRGSPLPGVLIGRGLVDVTEIGPSLIFAQMVVNINYAMIFPIIGCAELCLHIIPCWKVLIR